MEKTKKEWNRMSNKNVKKMGVSPITNCIYYGNVNEEKGLWVGEKKT